MSYSELLTLTLSPVLVVALGWLMARIGRCFLSGGPPLTSRDTVGPARQRPAMIWHHGSRAMAQFVDGQADADRRARGVMARIRAPWRGE